MVVRRGVVVVGRLVVVVVGRLVVVVVGRRVVVVGGLLRLGVVVRGLGVVLGVVTGGLVRRGVVGDGAGGTYSSCILSKSLAVSLSITEGSLKRKTCSSVGRDPMEFGSLGSETLRPNTKTSASVRSLANLASCIALPELILLEPVRRMILLSA